VNTNARIISSEKISASFLADGRCARMISGNSAQYLFQSHESSRDFYKNSTPELDLLVELARSHPAALGARLTGLGLGGGTINLIKRDEIKSFNQYMSAGYEKRLVEK